MWGRRPVFSYCLSFLKPYCYSNCNNRNITTTTTTTTRIPTGSSIAKMAMSSIDEADVGISCYISNLPGFRGILKQRYSDFIVNEVDLAGNVVHLTSLESPPESVQIVEEKELKTTQPLNKSYETEIQLFRSLVSESDVEHLKSLVDQITSGNKESIEAVVLSPDSDKAHRTEVHKLFKEKFKFLVTDTVDGPDASSKCIRVRLSAGSQSNARNSKKRKDRDNKPFDSRGSSSWPEHLGKFLKFHLYKENKDTQEALGIVGKMLGVQPRSFGFAGTKDKRSVSTQRVTVFKQSAHKLAALNEKLIGIKVGDFCYVKEGLLLGKLQGNRFTITLRGVVADSEDTIKAAANSLEKNGFINYFGLQRFGSGSVPTHLIGAALLRGEWKTAVSMILDPREGEKDMIAKARKYYKESGDIEGTLRQLPRHLIAERSICLKKCPGNYLQAVQAIPRTLRMMYVHSYQSYLWNHAASARVQKYGFDKIVVGDLVYTRRDDDQPVAGVISPECKDENSLGVHDVIDLDESSDMDLAVQGEVKVVTSEDILSGNYTIDDVVLPLPGSRIVYPNNDVSEVYSDLARKDQINLRESTHNVKDFSITSMTGAYRRVFQKPLDYQWKIIHYSDCNLSLADTDLDMIAKSEPLSDGEEKNPANGVEETNQLDSASHCYHETGARILANTTEDDGTNAPAIQTALQLAFTLPASCYATMAIRELLKSSTSVAFHKKLNQEAPLLLENQ